MKRFFVMCISIMMLAGCSQLEKEISMKFFLDDYSSKVKPVYKKMALAGWEASVTGNPESYKDMSDAEKMLADIYSSSEDFKKLKDFKNSEIVDPLIKRQIDLVYNAYASYQGDAELVNEIIERKSAIEKTFNTFRADLNGQKVPDNQLKKILKQEISDMALRKTAWEASKQIGDVVAGDIIELARLRNTLAQSLGYGNYFEMSLALSDLSEQQLMSLFDDLDDMLKGEYQKVKNDMDDILARRYGIQKEDIMPWHFEDPFFQDAVSMGEVDLNAYYADKDIVKIAQSMYSSIGLDVSDILERSSLYEQDGKMQHAFCTHIDKEGDVRILVNVKPDADWMDTVLHELGHAVYDKYLGSDLPFPLRDPAHSFTTEAVAQLFGRQARHAEFLKKYCGVSDEEADALSEKVYKITKYQQLVFSRWCQVMVRFEKELYSNTDKGEDYLNAVWWDLVEKYQGMKKPEGRNNPDWASKIHIAVYPVYYHNYMLGELCASQFQAAIAKKINQEDNAKSLFLGDNKRIGQFLKTEVFEPGAKYSWNEMIEKATGEALNPVYYRNQFVGE